MTASRRADVVAALAVGGAWCAARASAFDENAPGVDAALVAGYLALLVASWWAALALARRALGPEVEGAGLAFAALVSLALAGALRTRGDLAIPLLASLVLAPLAWSAARSLAAHLPAGRAGVTALDVGLGAAAALTWLARSRGRALLGGDATALLLAAVYAGALVAGLGAAAWLGGALSGARGRRGGLARLAACALALAALALVGRLPGGTRSLVLRTLPYVLATAFGVALLAVSRRAGRALSPVTRVAARRLAATAAVVALVVAAAAVLARAPLDRRKVAFHAAAAGTPRARLVLLAVDGVDPVVLDELLAAGALPNFARLRRDGSFGRLATISPNSPVVWTSVATGVTPEVHGVKDFVSVFLRGTTASLPRLPGDPWLELVTAAAGEERPVSSGTRRARALWEVLTLSGRSSLFVNWWATYPSEPVDGVMVSNFALPWSGLRESDYAPLARMKGLVSPAGLLPRVLATARAYAREAGLDDRFNQSRSQRIERFPRATQEFFAARDQVVQAVFEDLRREPRDLESVYLQQIDTGSHAYTEAAFGSPLGAVRPLLVPKAESERLFRELVASSYHRIDAIVGQVLETLGPDRSLLLLSDHGWRYDGSAHSLLPPGVVFLYGPRFRAGAELHGASVYDVFPTVASMLGAPLSRDLAGHVLNEAFLSGAEPRVEYLETYGGRDDRIEIEGAADDEGHLERLRALGYVK